MLTIHNDGLKPTFVKNNQTSYIDLKLSSASVSPLISGWTILDELGSDHNYMVMDIYNKQEQVTAPHPPRLRFCPERRERYATELFNALTPAITPDPPRYINEIKDQHKLARNNLKFLIAQANASSYDKFLEEVNSDP